MKLTIKTIKETIYGHSIMVYTEEGELLPLFIKNGKDFNNATQSSTWAKYKLADGVDLPDGAMKGHLIELEEGEIVRKGDTWERDGSTGEYAYDKIKYKGGLTIKIDAAAYVNYASNKATTSTVTKLIENKLEDRINSLLNNSVLASML